MTGAEFLRRVKRLGRQRGVTTNLLQSRGKGSHGLLVFGARQTVLKDLKKEIKQGLLHSYCRDLGIDRSDL